jgi:hypothetical protein
MPVQWKNVDLPLGAGMDDNTAKTALPPGKPRIITNAQYTTDGGYVKRRGFSLQVNGSLPVLGTADLLSYNDRTLRGYERPPVRLLANDLAWIDRGAFLPTSVDARVIRSSNKDYVGCDSFYLRRVHPLRAERRQQDFGADHGFHYGRRGLVQDRRVRQHRVPAPVHHHVSKNGNIYFYVCAGNVTLRAVKLSSRLGHHVGHYGATTWNGGGGTCYAARYMPDPVILRTGNIIFAGLFITAGSWRWGRLTLRPTPSSPRRPAPASSLPRASFTTPRGRSRLVRSTPRARSYFTYAYINTDTLIHANTLLLANGSFGNASGGGDTLVDTIKPKHITFADMHDGNVTMLYDDQNTYGTTASKIREGALFAVHGRGRRGRHRTLMRSVSLASDAVYINSTCYFGVIYYSRVTGSSSPIVASKFPSLVNAAGTLNSALMVADASGNVQTRSFRASAMTMSNISSASYNCLRYWLLFRLACPVAGRDADHSGRAGDWRARADLAVTAEQRSRARRQCLSQLRHHRRLALHARRQCARRRELPRLPRVGEAEGDERQGVRLQRVCRGAHDHVRPGRSGSCAHEPGRDAGPPLRLRRARHHFGRRAHVRHHDQLADHGRQRGLAGVRLDRARLLAHGLGRHHRHDRDSEHGPERLPVRDHGRERQHDHGADVAYSSWAPLPRWARSPTSAWPRT